MNDRENICFIISGTLESLEAKAESQQGNAMTERMDNLAFGEVWMHVREQVEWNVKDIIDEAICP